MEKKQKPFEITVIDDDIGMMFIVRTYVPVTERYCFIVYEANRDEIIELINNTSAQNKKQSINHRLN